MQNFRAVVRGFVELDAATQVADAEELETALTGLLMSPEKRNSQGARARAVVEANQGATRRTAEMTARVLSHLPFSAAR
jgi:3-deoxy-D-manno-octulosonic-acid transferase